MADASEIDVQALDPMRLDRRLRQLAGRWRHWRRRLRDAQGLEDDPFADSGELARRVLFLALGELERAGDPLGAPLRRWVYRLAEQRINRGTIAALERLWREDRIAVRAPEERLATRHELVVSALAEAERRRAWLTALIDAGLPLADAVAELWQRRREVAVGMALARDDELVLPCAGLDTLAERWLTDTADMFRELRVGDVAAYLTAALGADADGWPARLEPRTLAAFWAETQLLAALELDPGPWPAARGAASWLRALSRLGAAFTDASAPSRQPFCVAHDPYGLRRRTFGALFAETTLTLPFLKRRLGLGRDGAARELRVLARVVLLETRAAALRVRLRGPALAGKSGFFEAYEAETERCLGYPLEGRAAGSLFRLHADDGQRFAGWLLAAERVRTLTEAHDEDWFRNPRAAEELRAEADLSPPVRAEPKELADGAAELMRTLHSAMG